MVANVISRHKGIHARAELHRSNAQGLEEGHVGVVSLPGSLEWVSSHIERDSTKAAHHGEGAPHKSRGTVPHHSASRHPGMPIDAPPQANDGGEGQNSRPTPDSEPWPQRAGQEPHDDSGGGAEGDPEAEQLQDGQRSTHHEQCKQATHDDLSRQNGACQECLGCGHAPPGEDQADPDQASTTQHDTEPDVHSALRCRRIPMTRRLRGHE